MNGYDDWAEFVSDVSQIAGVGPDAIVPDAMVVEGGVLDSLALTEICVLVFRRSGEDLLDLDGNYRYPGMTWREMYELSAPGTAFIEQG